MDIGLQSSERKKVGMPRRNLDRITVDVPIMDVDHIDQLVRD